LQECSGMQQEAEPDLQDAGCGDQGTFQFSQKRPFLL